MSVETFPFIKRSNRSQFCFATSRLDYGDDVHYNPYLCNNLYSHSQVQDLRCIVPLTTPQHNRGFLAERKRLFSPAARPDCINTELYRQGLSGPA